MVKQKEQCWCRHCETERLKPLPMMDRIFERSFIVCPDCGNKRCPKATCHGHECGGSNDSGQPGSEYGIETCAACHQPATQGEGEPCSVCGGDGKETCGNPDHGFIAAVGHDIGRIGCPVCGHDPNHKVPNGGACEHCGGSGFEPSAQEECTCAVDQTTGWTDDKTFTPRCNVCGLVVAAEVRERAAQVREP